VRSAKIVGWTALGVGLGALAAFFLLQGQVGAQHARTRRAPNMTIGSGEVVVDQIQGSCVIVSKTAQIYARPGMSLRWYVVNYCNSSQRMGVQFPSQNPLSSVPTEVTVPAANGNVPSIREITGSVRGNAARQLYQYVFVFNGTALTVDDPDIIIDEWR
jgi:hypothetical protein